MRLLERDAELQSLRDGMRQAMAGHGVGIAVAGESGAGKSTVVAAALTDVGREMRVLRSQCEPLQTPRPLGPFRGLGLSEVDAQPVVSVVRVSELCDRFYFELSTQPTVLVIEDLHWLDEVSASRAGQRAFGRWRPVRHGGCKTFVRGR